MEDYKEIFAQMMKFQMESQQKNEEKLVQLQKENEERILKNNEKQQQFFLELQKQQEALFKSLSNNQPTTNSTTIFTQNAVWNALKTFSYAPDEDKIFEACNQRYEDIYITDCANWTDAKNVRLLLRKLGTVEHNKFVDYILPKKNYEFVFLETVKLHSELFSSKMSLFHKRWKCLHLTKRTVMII